MGESSETWLVAVAVHLRLHQSNLHKEKRPDEVESITQQASALQRSLNRFKAEQMGVLSPPPEGHEHHPDTLFVRLEDLLDNPLGGNDGVSPRELWEELKREVNGILTSLVAVLAQSPAGRLRGCNS